MRTSSLFISNNLWLTLTLRSSCLTPPQWTQLALMKKLAIPPQLPLRRPRLNHAKRSSQSSLNTLGVPLKLHRHCEARSMFHPISVLGCMTASVFACAATRSSDVEKAPNKAVLLLRRAPRPCVLRLANRLNGQVGNSRGRQIFRA